MTITDMTVTHDHDRRESVTRQDRETGAMTGQTRGRQSHVTVTHHTHVICSCLDRVITHRHINDIRINNIETTSTSMTFEQHHRQHPIESKDESRPRQRTVDTSLMDTPTRHPHRHPIETPPQMTPPHMTPPTNRRGAWVSSNRIASSRPIR